LKGLKFIRRLSLLVLAIGLLAVPGIAGAQSLAARANHLRREVVAVLGKHAAGRDIVRWGVLGRHGKTHRATRAELIRYRDVLARILVPPAFSSTSAPLGPGSSSSAARTATGPSPNEAVSASSSGALPTCTWAPESGGNWNAANPSSGAGGRYQILPSTWAANGGTGPPQDASPAEQTRVAENILHSQGPSAWANC
jgi:Transglycosylase-like domain